MMTPYETAAKSLINRVRIVLSENALDQAFEGETKSPDVVDHMGSKRPPFYVWVNPLPRTSSATGSASAHETRLEFDFYIYLFATHSKFDVALANINRWTYAIASGISADAMLDKSVDSAVCRLSDAGYEATTDKKYIVAAELDVRCSVFSQCPGVFKELIADAKKQS